jgi:rare lipoprotein A
MKTKSSIIIGLSIVAIFTLSGCITKGSKVESSSVTRYIHKSNPIRNSNFQRVTYGKASFYAKKFNGKRTASGERYNMYGRTAAHRTLPFNTMVRVTNILTNRSEIVRINDRGPSSKERIIDLSYMSAKKLGLINRGVGDVKLEVIDKRKVRSSVKLPISTQACVGDSCKATIIKGARKGGAKPFTILTKEDKVVERYSTRTYVADSTIADDDSYSSIEVVNSFPKIDTFSKKTSIQVGAFRRYAGAKVYAKRYSLLSRQYKAVIRNEMKDARPIYRVKIEGFSSEREARRFMSRYSLNGAFLVRR